MLSPSDYFPSKYPHNIPTTLLCWGKGWKINAVSQFLWGIVWKLEKIEMAAWCIAFAFLGSMFEVYGRQQWSPFKVGVIPYETQLMGVGDHQICTGVVIKASLLFTNIYRKLTLGHSALIMHLETNQRWCSLCSFSLLINERDGVPDKCSYYVLFIWN